MYKNQYHLNYILIAGLPRSGSTLLQAVLNNNQQTFTLPETHFFEEVNYTRSNRTIQKAQALELLYKLQTKWQLDLEEIIVNINNNSTIPYEIGDLYFKVIDSYCRNKDQNLIGIEKTPGNLFSMENLINRHDQFNVVLTCRNPRDFVGSMNKVYWAPDSIKNTANLWINFISEIHYLANKYPDRVKIVHYEDMVRKPKVIFKQIYDFCKLSWSNNVLLDVNKYVNDYILPSESVWKTNNIENTRILRTTSAHTLTLKQRINLHKYLFFSAIRLGYLSRYKF